MNQWKLTDLKVEKIIFTNASVKGKITDSVSENLTDSDLESTRVIFLRRKYSTSQCNSCALLIFNC